MREIKFRFWNPDDKRMLDDHEGWVENIGINEALRCSRDYGYIAMQFTGLKDKNGVEIYESDIVKLHDAAIYLVFWDEKGLRFALVELNEDGEPDYGSVLGTDADLLQDYTVVGNILEPFDYVNGEKLNNEQNDKRSIATVDASTTSAGSTKENK